MIRLGTRGSALALAQARWVAERLPGEVEIVPIKTSGDQPSTTLRKGSDPFPRVADKSRFVKEIEEALLRGDIDLAVHSAKDVPAELPDGLAIVGVPERADPRDAICVRTASSDADPLGGLPQGAVVGTSSLRRRALLNALRPDLDVRDLRGNVDTRLRRLAEGDFDAIVLARAGLERLGRGGEGQPLDPGQAGAPGFIPAAGQGCLALEALDDNTAASEAVAALNDRAALTALTAERALVRTLGATCHTPIGAFASTDGHEVRLSAFVGLPDGSHWIRDEGSDAHADPALLGGAVGRRMLAAGARELLAELETA